MTTATKTKMVRLECGNGHRCGFYPSANGSHGEFATGEHIHQVRRDSYAYTHGGCCYQAAQDCLRGLDVFHD